MRNHRTSHSVSPSDAVLRMSSPRRTLGMKTAIIVVVACLHAVGLYWALMHTMNVINIPDQQPSAITFELSAPAAPKAEAPGPVSAQPAVPAAPPVPEQKPVQPEKPPRPVEPKKKPVEKKPVEKPKPVKSAPAPAKTPTAPTESAPAAPSVPTTPAATQPSDTGASGAAAAPAGTGAQKAATVPAQVGRFQANNPNPKYPMQARRRHMEGLVVLTVRVNEEGRVVDARVKSSSGHDLLDDSALETVRQWQFEPGRQGSSTTASWTDVRINFRLN